MRSRVLVALAVLGCRRDPQPPPDLEIGEPKDAPAAAEKIPCRVGPKQTTLALDESGLHLRFVTERGNTVSMLGAQTVAGDPSDVTLADAVARFADGHAGAPWIDVDAKVTSPQGQTATVKVSLHIDHAMFQRLDAARGAAMLFPGEAQTASANKVAYVRSSEDAPPYIVGDGRWRDIDLFAFESVKQTSGKYCGAVMNGWNQTAGMSGHTTSHVELYDRRTGKRVDETTIDGGETCPDERDGGEVSVHAVARAWVSAKLVH